MIDHGTLLSIPFLKKSRFTGSDRGMRYSIYKIEEENETFLEAAACPGPFSVDFTKPELFTKKRFSFDDEGPPLTGSMSSTKKSASSLRMFIIIQINIIKSIIKRTNKRFVWQDTCIFIKMWYDSKGKHCSFCC